MARCSSCFLGLIWLGASGAFTLRKVLVTGGTRGLGCSICKELASSGHHVIITGRNSTQGAMLLESVKASGGSAEFVLLDVADPMAARKAVHHIEHEHGGELDLLVNNAGVCLRDNDKSEIFERNLEVNTWGPVRMMEALLPSMVRRRRGTVINVSSGDGELLYLHSEVARQLEAILTVEKLRDYLSELSSRGWNVDGADLAHLRWPAYCLSKAALNCVTRIIGTDAAVTDAGVRVVAVCPGDVATDMCDVDHCEAASPEDAALDVLWAAHDSAECPSGYFYRSRTRIPW